MTVQEVMTRHYTFIAKADLETGGWFIMYPDLPGVMTQAETYEEIGRMAREALELWVEAQLEDELPIPEPSDIPLPEWDWDTVGPALLTTKEVAERLHVTPRRVLALAADRGVGERFGRSVMFTEEDVAKLKPGQVGRPKVSR
jgi:predicted RNase H-like HicB family nuclease